MNTTLTDGLVLQKPPIHLLCQLPKLLQHPLETCSLLVDGVHAIHAVEQEMAELEELASVAEAGEADNGSDSVSVRQAPDRLCYERVGWEFRW